MIKSRAHCQINSRAHCLKKMKQNWLLYAFLLPALVYIILFNYLPMGGIAIAFKDFYATEGIWGSPWVGLKHFKTFLGSVQFWDLLRNTLTLSLYSLIVSFPIPIILALLLNYCTLKRTSKFTQTVTYAPHFISIVVMVGILVLFFSPDGMINQIRMLFGGEPIRYLAEPKLFKHLYVWSGIWQNTGWGSVIYIATLASVSPELHEAATVDGASKLQRIWHIDIPALLPTAIILLIMNVGSIMSIGFEKVLLMQNDINLGASEIISTYTYKLGLLNAQYSYSTAIGLFNNIINFILLISVNKISAKVNGTSLW